MRLISSAVACVNFLDDADVVLKLWRRPLRWHDCYACTMQLMHLWRPDSFHKSQEL